MIPTSLHVGKNLTGELVEVDHGGYANIYKGYYKNHIVAVKTIRTTMKSDLAKCCSVSLMTFM